MKEGMKIKVIKKDDIKVTRRPVTRTKRASARQVVSNVTSWVNDLQARKRDETKTAIEKFFNAQPRPSEL
jgi:hypothetical protein